MDRSWNQYVKRYKTAAIPSPVLPHICPHCEAVISWGWTEEERSDERFVGYMVRIRCIPRPDQTVFCPNCEAQILN